jgi:hypothetical protein
MTTTLTLLKFLLKLGIEIIEKWLKGCFLEIYKEQLRKNHCISETEYHIKLTLHLACGPLKAYC